MVGKYYFHFRVESLLVGWGSWKQEEKTDGRWMIQEKKLHINCLKLLIETITVKGHGVRLVL